MGLCVQQKVATVKHIRLLTWLWLAIAGMSLHSWVMLLDSTSLLVRAQLPLRCRIEDLSADQDSTDLQKCLQCATHHIQAHSAQFPELENVTALAVGNRLILLLSKSLNKKPLIFR